MDATGVILTIGNSKEHAITAIQKFNPQYLMLLTGKDLAASTKGRLTRWKKQYDLDGAVFVIDDLFGYDGPENIMTQTFLAIDALRGLDCKEIYLGITGGTTHMAAVATSAATMSGISVFYVKEPDGEQVVQPNKDVLLMPNINAFRAIRNMPVEVIELLRASVMDRTSSEDQGVMTRDEADKAGIPNDYMGFLCLMGVLEQLNETRYKLTYSGWSVVNLVRKSPNLERLLKLIQDHTNEESDHMFG